MDDSSADLQVLATDQGLLLLGPDEALATLDADDALRSRPASGRVLSMAGKALAAVGGVQMQSGRWFKVDDASAEFIRDHGITDIGTGVIRAKDIPGMSGGEILKHLKFQEATLLNPGAIAMAGVAMTLASIESSLDEMQRYLEQMDAKLDELLLEKKINAAAMIGGVELALDEAEAIRDATGVVSSVTWGKVEASSTTLMTIQAECVTRLAGLARKLREVSDDPDEAAKTLRMLRGDIRFWLGVLARAIILQDRQYALELDRVADADPAQSNSHQRGVQLARKERSTRLAASLEEVVLAVRDVADLGNLDRVVNPISTRRLTSGANGVNVDVATFARHADIRAAAIDELEDLPWLDAAKGLASDAAQRAVDTKSRVGRRVGRFTDQVRERREAAILQRADRIVMRRSRAEDGSGSQGGAGSGEPE